MSRWAAPFGGRQLLRTGLFVGGSVLVVGMFLFTQQVVRRLTEEIATTSRVFAQLCAQASFPATNNPQVRQIFSDVLRGIDFPIIITDTTGTPRAWRNVGVNPALVSTESLDSLSAGFKVSPVIEARVLRVRAEVADLDRRNRAIPMRLQPAARPLGALHYGEPAVLARLRWTPYVAVAGTGLLVLLGLSGLAGIRQAERRTLWVGLAKETAHQLGTPLSSLMGWVELLRAHAESAPAGGPLALGRAELGETLDDMERDIERLRKVAQRFSHIGSSPQLQFQDVTPVVREAVQYVRRRLPRLAGDVEIRERYEEVPPINLNGELLEWVIENLLTNALSALDKKPGRVEITVERRAETEEVEIAIADNGRGMTREEQGRMFEPGYSTKRRGWGLGLALSRRVVEEYHGGRIAVRRSVPGEGTTMVIRFPT